MLNKLFSIVAAVFLIIFAVGCSSEISSNRSEASNSLKQYPQSKKSADEAGSNSPFGNTSIINGNIPISAKYIGSIDVVTPIEAEINALSESIYKRLNRKPKILVSSLHMTNDWNRLVSNSAIDAGVEAGAEVIATNAQGNWNRQVDDVEKAIADKVDAIVIAGGIAKSLQEVIKKAAEAGIPTTTVDIPSPYVLTDVTSDNYSGAAMLAMKMALDMNGKGNIAVIYSPGWHSIDIRRWMLDEVLKDWPDIHIVAEYPVDEEDAINGTQTTMESILNKFPQKDSINAVYTGFGLAGVGAAKAIEAAGRSDDIGVYTVDADIIVLQDMLQKNGAIKAVIGQTTTQLGRTATVAALKGIIGDTKNIQRQTFCPITLVTKDNAKEIGKYLYGDEWKY